MRIGIVTASDASDPRSWSGTHYFSSKALCEHVGETVHIGPIQPLSVLFNRVESRTRKFLSVKDILTKQSIRVARDNARIVRKLINQKKPDILFAPAGSALIAYLETSLPILYSSDATARLMFEYYPEFTEVSARSIRQADELERRSIARADALMYPSQWAAQSAIEDYHADPRKIHVIPFGANFANAPDRERALTPRPGPAIKLLFVGVNWDRKGGAIAVAALRELLAKGVNAELTVVGCIPPESVDRDRVEIFPFLDKNDPVQAKKLSSIYLTSDLLILPTRNECYGIVFCEAAAHGVPSIATATGGVPDVIRDRVTGFVLPAEADGKEYADRIIATISDKENLATLRKNARDDYEKRLNWEVWASRMKPIVDEVLAKYQRRTA